MAYPFAQAWFDSYGRRSETLGLGFHMAEGGGTVGYLDNKGSPPERGVSVHAVCEYSGRVVQMLGWDRICGGLNPKDRASADKGYYGGDVLRAVLGSWWTNPNAVSIQMELEGHAEDGPNPDQVKAAIAWGLDMRRLFPSLRGAFGHADQTDTKGCPGTTAAMRAIFAGVGGHGLWTPQEENPEMLPITDPTEKLVDIAVGKPLYDLNGQPKRRPDGTPVKVSVAQNDRPSPFGTRLGTTNFRAVYITTGGMLQLLLVRTTDAVLQPVLVADCSAVVAAAVTPLNEQITSLKSQLASQKERGRKAIIDLGGTPPPA